MGKIVCRKVPVAKLVLYFDFWVKKLAKSAKAKAYENDGYPFLFLRI
jgi:hypothetical protein